MSILLLFARIVACKTRRLQYVGEVRNGVLSLLVGPAGVDGKVGGSALEKMSCMYVRTWALLI